MQVSRGEGREGCSEAGPGVRRGHGQVVAGTSLRWGSKTEVGSNFQNGGRQEEGWRRSKQGARGRGGRITPAAVQSCNEFSF